MIILSVYTIETCLFDHNGDIIHISILTSVRVEPTNAECAPCSATSDALNHFTTNASIPKTKKDAQVAHITKPDAAIHSV